MGRRVPFLVASQTAFLSSDPFQIPVIVYAFSIFLKEYMGSRELDGKWGFLCTRASLLGLHTQLCVFHKVSTSTHILFPAPGIYNISVIPRDLMWVLLFVPSGFQPTQVRTSLSTILHRYVHGFGVKLMWPMLTSRMLNRNRKLPNPSLPDKTQRCDHSNESSRRVH